MIVDRPRPKRPLLLRLAVIVCFFHCVCAIQALGQTKVTVFKNGTEGYKIYRIPALVKATNGDVLAFCEARAGGGASEIDLVLKRSNDGGLSWQALEVVQDNAHFGELFEGETPPISVGNPAPVVDLIDPQHKGRIWLPFTVENDRVFVCFSDDHGKSWSSRREITATVKKDPWGWYATGPVHSIQIERGQFKGRLIIPCDHRIGPDGQDRGKLGAHVVWSDDHGQTWHVGAIDNSYDDGMNTNETTVVALNDGRLYFNSRNQHGMAKATRGEACSGDGGASFGKSGERQFHTFTPSDPVLDPPVVQCSLLRVWSTAKGDASNLILFSGPDQNGPSGPGRSDLRIRYSNDETKTWNDGALIHTGPAAYSDMVKLGPTEVGVLFEAGNKGTRIYDQIVFVTMSIKALLGTKSPRGAFR